MTDTVYTIGHSIHAMKKFIELLAANGVTAIADVRSHPYSRYNPQFNQDPLRADLKKAGIAYVFLGRELGARAEDRACYVDGKVQYDRLAGTATFQQGLARIERGVLTHRIALMCAEKDPLTCHRAILVCRSLALRGVDAQHILDTGNIEPHRDALVRLLAEHGLGEHELFASREELIAEAYQRRGEQIAYSEKQAAAEASSAK